MPQKRKVEIFSAGCPICEETVALVRRITCSSCEIDVLDMRDDAATTKAKSYGIRSVPAVVIDGQIASCCRHGGPDEGSLRAAGIGVARP